MKVIDLLNKIANHEEIPIRIRVKGYEYRQSNGQFWCDETETYLISGCTSIYCLNDEVEIIEEEEKIPEKLEYQVGFGGTEQEVISEYVDDVVTKVNEIIDYLQSKGDE